MVGDEGNNSLFVCLLQSVFILCYPLTDSGVITIRTIAAQSTRSFGDEVRLDAGMEGGL